MRLLPDDVLGALTLVGEGRGESYFGRVCIGEVIRTRMARKLFSEGDVASTVLRDRQFSCWNAGDPNRLVLARMDDADPIYLACLKAWHESAVTIATRGATHYYATWMAKPPAWAADPENPSLVDESKVTLREGRHIFLKL